MKENNQFFKWRGVNVLSATFLLTTLFFTVACKKQETGVGKDTLPIDVLLGSGGVDTFTLKTYTYQDDTVYTGKLKTVPLGIMHDPDMGVIQAGIYSQFELAYLTPNIPSSSVIEIDSFVLSLEFNSAYGEISRQKVEVYELDEAITQDSSLFSTQDFQKKSLNWVTDNYSKFDNIGNTVVGTDTLRAQVRVRLNVTKAAEIIERVKTNPADFTSNTAFLEYLKGFYITATEVEGGATGMIGSFNLVDQDSKFRIYFKRDGEVQTMDLVASASTKSCVRYSHNIAGTALEAQLNNPDLGMEKFYAKAGKYRAVVEMPTILDIPKNAIVHSALLYLPVEANGISVFAPSGVVSAMTKNKRQVLAYSSTGYESYIKGYLMDLKLYVQSLLTGISTETTLLISPDGFANTGNRLIFNGPNTTNKLRPKLVITYTEF